MNEPVKLTSDVIKARVRADFAAVLGRVIEVPWVYGYRGNDSIDLMCDPPARVRVLPTPEEDLDHQVDGWYDPYWNVAVLEPADCDLRSCWVFGPSYQEGGADG